MSEKTITWEAKEYVQKDKKAGWYVGLIFVGLLFVGLGILLKWWSFIALIVVSVLALIVYSVRPARDLKYRLDSTGLSEGTRKYNFVDYRSFGVLVDGEYFAIVLNPRKRFSGRVRVYFPSEQGEKIVDAFGAHLPMEPVRLDFLDKIINFLRI
ncbi:hypothetical protein IJ103_02575 [Candidatus Saccharibacteria bacterium]|nr:hypothetical protein [Candidatus Saccharibacteria bacterium]MBQ9017105.1 hypothetical protein [Candidatus Saccharibacteria bacterium]